MKKHWFKRKTYGWGWQPSTKEGWIVTVLFVAAVIVNATVGTGVELSNERLVIFGLLGALFVVIAAKTGEKPKWQWGKKK